RLGDLYSSVLDNSSECASLRPLMLLTHQAAILTGGHADHLSERVAECALPRVPHVLRNTRQRRLARRKQEARGLHAFLQLPLPRRLSGRVVKGTTEMFVRHAEHLRKLTKAHRPVDVFFQIGT